VESCQPIFLAPDISQYFYRPSKQQETPTAVVAPTSSEGELGDMHDRAIIMAEEAVRLAKAAKAEYLQARGG